MKAKLVLAALTLAVSHAHALDTSSVIARGHKISVGDTADSVFASLKQQDMVSQEIERTPTGLKLTKHYRVNGQVFVLVLTRTGAEGPYTITSIDSEGAKATSEKKSTKP